MIVFSELYKLNDLDHNYMSSVERTKTHDTLYLLANVRANLVKIWLFDNTNLLVPDPNFLKWPRPR